MGTASAAPVGHQPETRDPTKSWRATYADIREIDIPVSISLSYISSRMSGFRNRDLEASRSLAVDFANIASTRFAQLKCPTEEPGGLAVFLIQS